jgi:hypothetical protein
VNFSLASTSANPGLGDQVLVEDIVSNSRSVLFLFLSLECPILVMNATENVELGLSSVLSAMLGCTLLVLA